MSLKAFRRDLARWRVARGYDQVRGAAEGVLLDNGVQAVLLYRIAHSLRELGVPLLPALIRRLSVVICGTDILPAARIGPGCVIAHGIGLVIGGNVVIGENCTLLHGVTLGESRFDGDGSPTIGNNVTIGTGAKILGEVTVGDGATIGACALVLSDVPPRMTAVGVPARVIDSPGARTVS